MSVGDLNLWERYTIKHLQPDGSLVCKLDADNVPDIVAKFEGGTKPLERVSIWYNYVKERVNAWEAEQEAAAAKRAEASRASSKREDPRPVVSGGSEIPTAAAAQTREASVEAIIEAKIADLGRSLARVEDQIAATSAAQQSLMAERNALKRERPSPRFGGALREDSPVDAGNLGRGPYVWGKAEAERMVTDFCQTHGIGQRQIRLGPLVDFSNFTPPGRLGREVGPLFVAIGTPGNRLSVCDEKTASNVIRHYRGFRRGTGDVEPGGVAAAFPRGSRQATAGGTA